MKMNKAVPILFAALALAMLPEMAMAEGLTKVNTFFQNLVTWLRILSISLVTLAIMWCGYKMLFQQSQFRDISHVFFGALFIGSAVEIANYLMA